MNGKRDALLFEGLVKGVNKILIVSHMNPDGDAVGSTTALRNYLTGKGMNVRIALPNAYPDYLSFLDTNSDILIFSESPEATLEVIDSAELIIALDFNQINRIDEMGCHIMDSDARKVLMDHHPMPQNELFELVISDTDVSSTCELVYRYVYFSEGMDVNAKSVLPSDVAESLYVGMMTDTNNFANSVNSHTFAMAAHLMRSGVDKERLQHLVFGGFSENRMRLMGHLLLNKMVVLDKYGVGYITLSAAEQKQFDFNNGDSEGFVNLPLNIKGVNVSALFTEKSDHARVSLRSVDDFSVNLFSRLHFNGGGHERAAGGRLTIPFEDIPGYLEKALEASFEECKGAGKADM
jgi:phosphoesterase RecJ-like protein